MNRVLVVSPHMDDETLGVGGTIVKHVESGDKVKVCFICHRKYDNCFDSTKNEVEIKHSLNAMNILKYHEVEHLNLEDERLDYAIYKIVEPLTKVALEFKPDIIYIPSFADNNQDHRAVFEACMIVFRSFAISYQSILSYEVPSSTEQSFPVQPFLFNPNYYVDIYPFLEKKLSAMSAYETEKREVPHPRSSEAIKILAQKRGFEVSLKTCEAFIILRYIW